MFQGLSLRKPINVDANLAEVVVLGSRRLLTLKAKHNSTLRCLSQVFHSHRCLWLHTAWAALQNHSFLSDSSVAALSSALSFRPERFSLLQSLGIPLPILHAQATEIFSCLGLLSKGKMFHSKVTTQRFKTFLADAQVLITQS